MNVLGGLVKNPGHRVVMNLWCVADAGERKTAPTAGGRRRPLAIIVGRWQSDRCLPGKRPVSRCAQSLAPSRDSDAAYVADLAAQIGVSYWTLRDCCLKYLGMSPKRYLWLRRMNLARRALRRANAETKTVTEIAAEYGFCELGRFSVAYRSLFGESPSTALRRPPDGPRT